MIVFVEVILINNLCVDALLIASACIARRRGIKTGRVLLASLIGAVGALGFCLATEPVKLIIKILLAPAMCIVGVGACGKNMFFKIGDLLSTTILFALFTFMAGGIVYGLSFATGMDLKNHLALGICSLGTLVVLVFARLVSRKRSSLGADICSVELKCAGNQIEASALLDSGNLLVDDVSGLPVVMLSKRLEDDLKGAEVKGYINVQTACGNDDLALVDIDEIDVCGKKYRALGALTHRPLDGFDVILQSSML